MRSLLVLSLSILCAASAASALPFNDDMVLNNMKTGRIMRQLPPGTVARGASATRVESKEEALKLQNPLKNDESSSINGERLFVVNCAPCHGDIASNPYKPGMVTKFMPGPPLAVDMYREKPKDPNNGTGRSDGQIYGTIHFGGMLMPAVGYKLSPTEHWDIINYIRKVQNAAP